METMESKVGRRHISARQNALTSVCRAQADREELLEVKMEMEAMEKRVTDSMKAQFKAVLESLSAKAHKEAVEGSKVGKQAN